MQVFISYSAVDRDAAEEIQLALMGLGHSVFFDRDSLPAGGNYHERIDGAIRAADIMVFLISPSSIAPGSYALTELKFARAKWPHPRDRVLPVRLHDTAWAAMPPYLKSVTVLEPSGNIAAEVVAAVVAMRSTSAEIAPLVEPAFSRDGATDSGANKSQVQKAQIWIAMIGLAGVLGAAVLTNWDKLFPAQAISTPKLKRARTRIKEFEVRILRRRGPQFSTRSVRRLPLSTIQKSPLNRQLFDDAIPNRGESS